MRSGIDGAPTPKRNWSNLYTFTELILLKPKRKQYSSFLALAKNYTDTWVIN